MNHSHTHDLLNHSAGKGDKERSPGWRANYSGIDFHRSEAPDGFARRGNKQVKLYGQPGRVAKFVFPEVQEAFNQEMTRLIAAADRRPEGGSCQ
jgi:hypothetical protein